MKAFAAVIALLASSSAFAGAPVCTQLDAQIIAHVTEITPVEGTGLCLAKLSFDGKYDMYNENYTCALPYDEVIARGVATECDKTVGDQVDGIVYRSVRNDKTIYLY